MTDNYRSDQDEHEADMENHEHAEETYVDQPPVDDFADSEHAVSEETASVEETAEGAVSEADTEQAKKKSKLIFNGVIAIFVLVAGAVGYMQFFGGSSSPVASMMSGSNNPAVPDTASAAVASYPTPAGGKTSVTEVTTDKPAAGVPGLEPAASQTGVAVPNAATNAGGTLVSPSVAGTASQAPAQAPTQAPGQIPAKTADVAAPAPSSAPATPASAGNDISNLKASSSDVASAPASAVPPASMPAATAPAPASAPTPTVNVPEKSPVAAMVAASMPTPAPATPATPAHSVTPVSPTPAPAAVISDKSAADNRAKALADRLDKVQVKLDPAATPIAQATDSSLDDRLNRIEQNIIKLETLAATKKVLADETQPSIHIAHDDSVEGDVPAKSKVKTVVKKKPVAKKLAKAPVAKKSKWVLRAATPDEVWVSTSVDSDKLTHAKVGDKLEGIGRITAIVAEGDSWVIKGTKGSIR